MKIDHGMSLYCREGHFEVCLTLPDNIRPIERHLHTFSTFRKFFLQKLHKMPYFMTFCRKNIRKIENLCRCRSIGLIMLGSVKHT